MGTDAGDGVVRVRLTGDGRDRLMDKDDQLENSNEGQDRQKLWSECDLIPSPVSFNLKAPARLRDFALCWMFFSLDVLATRESTGRQAC